MRKTPWIALAAWLVVGAMVFAACNNDNNGEDGDNNGTTPAAQRTTSAGDDGETREAGPTQEPDNGDGGGDSGELEEIAQRFADATFHATYEMSGGGLGDVTNGQITIYKDGSDKLRFDIKGEQDGQAFEASFIETGSESYLCLLGDSAAGFGALIGVDAGAGVCLKSTPDDPTNPVGSIVEELQSFDAENVELQSKEQTEIAGEDATCYTVLDNETNEINTACFNDDGVLLSVGAEGETNLTATSIEGSVSASDFEPPYPVQEIPGLGE